MSHPTRLVYVDGRGHGERIRFALAGADIDYEEVFLKTRQERLDLVSSKQLVGGVVPLLEIDGVDMVQSWAAIRYIARNHGLEPSTPAEQARADMYNETVRDFETAANLVSYGWVDKTEHKEKVKAAVEKWFPRLEQATKGPFALGDKPYYPDYVLLNSLLYIDDIFGPEFSVAYPKLCLLKSKVSELPQIKKFLGSNKRKGLVDDSYLALCKEVFF